MFGTTNSMGVQEFSTYGANVEFHTLHTMSDPYIIQTADSQSVVMNIGNTDRTQTYLSQYGMMYKYAYMTPTGQELRFGESQVAYFNNGIPRALVVGYGTNNLAMTTDFKTFSYVNLTAISVVSYIAVGNGVALALGWDGKGYFTMGRSTNVNNNYMSAWSVVTPPTSMLQGAIGGMVFYKGKFFLPIDEYLYFSTNGINWQVDSDLPNKPSRWIKVVNGVLFLATTDGSLYLSIDGVNFSDVTPTITKSGGELEGVELLDIGYSRGMYVLTFDKIDTTDYNSVLINRGTLIGSDIWSRTTDSQVHFDYQPQRVLGHKGNFIFSAVGAFSSGKDIEIMRRNTLYKLV